MQNEPKDDTSRPRISPPSRPNHQDNEHGQLRQQRKQHPLAAHQIFKYKDYKPAHSRNALRRQHVEPTARLREKFWQTACRVYLSPQAPNVEKIIQDGNAPLDWDYVIGASVMSAAPLICPICLEAATLCPRITKCGHVYCLTCLIKFFQSEALQAEQKRRWRKCPLCAELVLAEDMRPCRFQRIEPLTAESDEATFVHVTVSRETGVLNCRPLSEEREWKSPWTPFDRVVVVDDPLLFYRDDHMALYAQQRLCVEIESQEEAAAVVAAMENLIGCITTAGGNIDQLDADFAREMAARLAADSLATEWEVLSLIADQDVYDLDSVGWKKVVTRFGDSVVGELNDREETHSELAANFDMDSTDFHFYQLWDGQLAILNPIYLRALLHNVDNDIQKLPPVVPDLRLLTSQTIVLDRTKASRFPYLSHLPTGLCVSFYDVNILYLLRKWTLSCFAPQLSEIMQRCKRDSKRRLKADKVYEAHSKKEALRQAHRGGAPLSSDELRLARAKLTELDTPSNFPTLHAQSAPAESVAPSPTIVKNSFRDSLRLPEAREDNFPSLGPSLSVGQSLRKRMAEIDDDTPGNWRTGGVLIVRNGVDQRPSRWTSEAERLAREESHRKRYEDVLGQRSSSVASSKGGAIFERPPPP